MNFTSISTLHPDQIRWIIKRAQAFKEGGSLKINQSVANIFLEPSTRTLMSFQVAQKNLSMDIYNIQADTSSFTKGESLEDTLLNLEAMGINTFVIRSKENAYWENFKQDHNIINAGDGTMNHPSQALLDAMTIEENFGTLENLKVLIVGDVKHSRVYESNKVLLEKFGSTVDVVAPVELGGNDQELKEVIGNYDIVMFLRVQHERHAESFSVAEYNRRFGLNNESVALMKEDAIFMHPGPVNRGVEIEEELLYKHPKCKVLEQVTNGVYIRMAILEFMCKNI